MGLALAGPDRRLIPFSLACLAAGYLSRARALNRLALLGAAFGGCECCVSRQLFELFFVEVHAEWIGGGIYLKGGMRWQ
jgi:hypothetical protein